MSHLETKWHQDLEAALTAKEAASTATFNAAVSQAAEAAARKVAAIKQEAEDFARQTVA